MAEGVFLMRANVQIALGEKHLDALIRGAEVKVTVQGVIVRMILSDIGFHVIQRVLDDARLGPSQLREVYEDKQ